MKGNTLAIALASLLVGGVAVGAYHNSRDAAPRSDLAAQDAALAVDAVTGEPIDAPADALEYADVLAVQPVTESGQIYATVLGTEPVRETMTSTSFNAPCRSASTSMRARRGSTGRPTIARP